MEKKSKDHLATLVAMLTVFLCGFGIGHLVGEKKGLQNAPQQVPHPLTDKKRAD